MNDLKDICTQYGVSLESLQQFIEVGISNDAYEEATLHSVKSCICLHSIGLEADTIKKYMCLDNEEKDTKKARIKVLQKSRASHLKNMHDVKKTLDCMHCIFDEIQGEEQ